MANKPKLLSILGETSGLYLKYALGLLSVVALIWFLVYGPIGQTGVMFSRIVCCCASWTPAEEDFAKAEKVFVGKVVREVPPTAGSRGKHLKFEVISAWKGVHQQRFTILDDTGCPPNPAVGELWLIYGHQEGNGAVTMNICASGSSTLAYARPEDLDYLGDAEWGARRVPHVYLRQDSVFTAISSHFSSIITNLWSIIPWQYWSWVTIMATTTGLAIWGIKHVGTV
jgi:hypothetical protein